ncbi:DUF3769 domain-containing protein [Synechocystis sp. B12]|nr:DUF3769 domain-containing protein [Synechocystis sp. B12]
MSNQSLNDRLAINQPVTNVVGQEGFSTGIGASTPGAQSASQTETGGQVNRLRFQAEQVDFDADGWRAKKSASPMIRLTRRNWRCKRKPPITTTSPRKWMN